MKMPFHGSRTAVLTSDAERAAAVAAGASLVRAVVPLRAGIAGGGSDLSAYYLRRVGRCLNMALDAHLAITLDADGDGRLAFEMPGDAETSFGKTMVGLSGLLERGSVTVESGCMPGWGLGCSSALLVGLTALRRYLDGLPLDGAAIAEAAWQAEAVALGLPVGKQDHYASSFGGINQLEFREDRVLVQPLRISSRGRRLLDECLLIAGTGKPRHASDTLTGQDAACREGDGDVLDAIDERVALVPAMGRALAQGDADSLAALMRLDWEVKGRMAEGIYGNGTVEAMERALRAGAAAGRLLGAGGSGYLLLLTAPDRREWIRRELARHFRHVRPVAPAQAGVHVTEVERR
jgi:D-glycero-alpha-D-manno-heptose-7-phosphate kinase